MTEVRDWNKDKEEIERFIDGWIPGGASNNKDAVMAFFYFAKDALPYWHLEAEKWFSRANELVTELMNLEEREKKLRESITGHMKDSREYGYNGVADLLERILYPLDKEEEAK